MAIGSWDRWAVPLVKGQKVYRGRVSPGAVSMRIKLMVSFSRQQACSNPTDWLRLPLPFIFNLCPQIVIISL